MEMFIEKLTDEFRCVSTYNITSTCKYDLFNNLIKNETKEYLLTKREDLFIKLLLTKRGIVTYFEMDRFLNENCKEFSSNAKRLFVKNFRKKLPKDLLINISGVGYKLAL